MLQQFVNLHFALKPQFASIKNMNNQSFTLQSFWYHHVVNNHTMMSMYAVTKMLAHLLLRENNIGSHVVNTGSVQNINQAHARGHLLNLSFEWLALLLKYYYRGLASQVLHNAICNRARQYTFLRMCPTNVLDNQRRCYKLSEFFIPSHSANGPEIWGTILVMDALSRLCMAFYLLTILSFKDCLDLPGRMYIEGLTHRLRAK